MRMSYIVNQNTKILPGKVQYKQWPVNGKLRWLIYLIQWQFPHNSQKTIIMYASCKILRQLLWMLYVTIIFVFSGLVSKP